jgi:flavodoxin I
MKIVGVFLVPLLLSLQIANGWILPTTPSFQRITRLDAAVGIFYGTSTGNTLDCAMKIFDAFGSDVCAEPVDVDSLDAEQLSAEFGAHTSLIVGTPTWNTGADTERSGTGWDELYYSKLLSLSSVLGKKKVAVFGLGDQVSYAENYGDAAGELYSVFESLGCNMVPYAATSQDGYEHVTSKSIRGDKFCGLMLDQINQEDLTDARIEAWVEQLIAGGFLNQDANTVSVPASVVDDAVETDAKSVSSSFTKPEESLAKLEEASSELDQNISTHSSGGFTPHFNPVTKKTMWTSPDGRKSFVTTMEDVSSLRP